MYVRYKDWGSGGEICQVSIDKFLTHNFNKSDPEGIRSDLQIQLEGTYEVVCNMIVFLVEKGLMSDEEFRRLLPNKVNLEIISLDTDRDYGLIEFDD